LSGNKAHSQIALEVDENNKLIFLLQQKKPAYKIKGAYLLVHGSADDNVHYQNTVEMAKALIEADVDFEMMIYPNHNHGISGGNARLHLYRYMTNFLERNMKQ